MKHKDKTFRIPVWINELYCVEEYHIGKAITIYIYIDLYNRKKVTKIVDNN